MIYLDTGCLLKLYYPEPDSAAVARVVTGAVVAFLGLHEVELTNALEQKAFRREAKPAQTRAVLSLVASDIQGGVLHRATVDWDIVLRDATTLAKAHTRRIGCRSLDILHCAAAQALGVSAFITTDARQRRLALAMGLKCPSV